MCKDKISGVPVQTSASLALIRIGGGTKIISHWSEVISTKLESILDCKIADPNALSSVSDCASALFSRFRLNVITFIQGTRFVYFVCRYLVCTNHLNRSLCIWS